MRTTSFAVTLLTCSSRGPGASSNFTTLRMPSQSVAPLKAAGYSALPPWIASSQAAADSATV
jgi:hypothetical protein